MVLVHGLGARLGSVAPRLGVMPTSCPHHARRARVARWPMAAGAHSSCRAHRDLTRAPARLLPMREPHDGVIVGAGQAGLATSHVLAHRGVPHGVLEKVRVGQAWRGRRASFCPVTPNWTMRLPERPHDGEDPRAFCSRVEIVGFPERYAHASRTPPREGVKAPWRPRSPVGALRRGGGPPRPLPRRRA